MAEVRLVDIIKKFGHTIAVDNINLTVNDKEFLVLVGPSGCGKTTTLRMIAGLEESTQGDIFIGNQKVNYVPPKDRDVAMVFQNYALYPHMNVYRNMAFGLKLRKFPKTEIDSLVRNAAKVLGIEGLLMRKPKELSGGQRQRVAMGRAIVRSPKAFLLDEPLSNLDAKLRVQMRGELARLHERLETTMIYVTHDQTEAMTLADRIVVMDQGIIKQVGRPLEVYNIPQNLFVAGFIGSPAMNFFEVRLSDETGKLYAVNKDFKLAIPESFQTRFEKLKDGEMTLGIRPEHIYDKKLTPSFPGSELIKGHIEVFEPVGREVMLIAACGSTQFAACVDSQTTAQPHVDMEFLVDMNRAHFFNKSSGEAC